MIVAGILAGILGKISLGIATGIAFGIAFFRTYYYLLHPIFIWPTVKGNWYCFHPVAWDNLCLLPFPGLDRLLVAYAERAPDPGAQEIERLISSYPSQRMAALRARSVLLARQAGRETRLDRLDSIVARLPEGRKGFLAETPKLREMVGDICRLQNRLDTQTRPFLLEPTASQLCDRIENFQHRLSGFSEPLASEFRSAAQHWLEIARQQHQNAQARLSREPTPQVFRAGDPVDRSKEAFVPRDAVIGDLDRQLMLSTGCPGLILYGRRRMGKSTLLRNLDGFLSEKVYVVNIPMQEPRAFTSMETFLDLLTQNIRRTWPGHDRPPAGAGDLMGFFDFLSNCNERLPSINKRMLLALDEYEYLDIKIGEGVFKEDLLATIRESIQSHRELTWIFSGGHHISELTHADWSSYLVSVRTLEILPFTEKETRLLLTEPLKFSHLWDTDDPKRPRFDPMFWGDSGIERIQVEASGWPHLVQLLAETTVNLLNDLEDAHQVDDALLEQAANKAIVTGDAALRQLMRPKDAPPQEWDYLRGFRMHDTQPPPDEEQVRQALQRRLLVTQENGEWRLRVPLLEHWLRQRGG